MRNITVSVPDEVYRTVRVRAAELDTSVSALVTEFLRSMLSEDPQEVIERQKRAEINRRLDAIIATFPPGFSAADNLTREELYNEGFDRH